MESLKSLIISLSLATNLSYSHELVQVLIAQASFLPDFTTFTLTASPHMNRLAFPCLLLIFFLAASTLSARTRNAGLGPWK